MAEPQNVIDEARSLKREAQSIIVESGRVNDEAKRVMVDSPRIKNEAERIIIQPHNINGINGLRLKQHKLHLPTAGAVLVALVFWKRSPN